MNDRDKREIYSLFIIDLYFIDELKNHRYSSDEEVEDYNALLILRKEPIIDIDYLVTGRVPIHSSVKTSTWCLH